MLKAVNWQPIFFLGDVLMLALFIASAVFGKEAMYSGIFMELAGFYSITPWHWHLQLNLPIASLFRKNDTANSLKN